MKPTILSQYPGNLAVILCIGLPWSVAGCRITPDDGELSPDSFAGIVQFLDHNADTVVLRGDGGPVLVSPKLQGRIMTMTAGHVPSTGFVNFQAIREGEVHEHFNNFGGIDRFWIGPEAGPYGIYFAPGAEFNRDTWQVPASFDKGPFKVVEKSDRKVIFEREMEVSNYKGVSFRVHVKREVGVISAESLGHELGIDLPAGVFYSGCYSDNVMANIEDRKWDKESGLIGIWILGQFNPSKSSVVIAPVETGEGLGPAFNDDYFGKVSEVTPDRIALVQSPDGGSKAVVFRADACHVGKFGLSQKRTKGLAGSYDFSKDLLTVVKFTKPTEPELYGNSTWVVDQAEPYGGDVLQSYNNGDAANPGALAAEPFYELESTSPVRPLGKGESIRHRHATHHFQGDPAGLAELAREILGVDLDDVRKAMKL